MKRFAKIAILLCICVFALIGVAACSSVTGISIDKKNNTSLQTVFVQGQELDLSGGVLTVTTDEGTKFVSLDSEDVTVTGYDNQTVGNQTLTVTYGGKSTTLTITVVKRINVANMSTEYFVGDTFNKEKGVLQIYNNDGTSFNVNMSDDTVSVSGFDSSKAGNCNVTLTYKSGTDEYSDTVAVTVYEVNTITIKRPNKIVYKSHETELDLSGGYITVKNSDGSYSKSISITEDMVSGFDISAATYENSRNTELIQTLTITYGNKTTTFDISITYSDVSVIQDCAEQFSGLSWGSSIPYITDEQGELAIEALGLFDTLSDEDKEYIEDDVYLAVARVASVYGITQLNAVLNSNKAVIQYNNDEYEFISCGYEDAKADYEKLSTETILNIADQLLYVINNFGEETLFGNITIGTYLDKVPGYVNSVTLLGLLLGYYDSFVYSYEYQQVAEGEGDYVYDSESDTYVKAESGKGNYELVEQGVPSDWSLDSTDSKYLENYSKTIITVYSDIIYSDFYSSAYRSAYSLLNDWRSDFFNILYEYWAISSAAAVTNLSVVYLTYPFDEIEELTNQLYSEYYNIYSAVYYTTSYDASYFMYYYEEYLKYLDIAENSSDTVTQILYEMITITVSDGLSYTISEWLKAFTYSSYSYNGRTYFYTGIDAIDELWSDYLNVITQYVEAFNEGGFNIENFVSGSAGDDIAAMFEKFVELSPAEQYAFLRSIDVSFSSYYPIGLYFTTNSDDEIVTYNLFTLFVANYYRIKLNNDEEFELFNKLLMSLEYYARQYNLGISYFISYMKDSISDYNTYSGITEDGSFGIGTHNMTNFNNCLGFLYTKYKTIYNLYDSEGNYTASTDLGEWADTFDELATCLEEVYIAYGYVYNRDSTNKSAPYYYMAIYSAFESAELLAQKIISEASESIVNAYYYMPVQITIGSNTYSFSLDYTLSVMREYYGYYMSYTQLDDVCLKDVYKTGGLQTFVQDINYLFRIYLQYDQTTYGNYNSQTVLSLMSEFRSLTAEQRELFIEIDTYGTNHYENSLYYCALNDFFFNVLSEDAATVADWLMTTELSYIFYENSPEGKDPYGKETKEAFKSYMSYTMQRYEALSATDKAAFDELLGDVYATYVAVYNTITNA